MYKNLIIVSKKICFTNNVIVNKEMTWVTVEYQDTEICLKEGSFPRMGYSMHSRTHLYSSSSYIFHENKPFNVDFAREKPTLTDVVINLEKYKIHNWRQELKLTLDYYHKNMQLSGGVDEDWLRHLTKRIRDTL